MLTTLPNHRGLIRSLFAYDIVGFQTETDLKAFQEYVVEEIGGRALGEGALSAYGRTMRAGAFPIGLDTKQFVELASSPQARHQAQAMRQSLHGRHILSPASTASTTPRASRNGCAPSSSSSSATPTT